MQQTQKIDLVAANTRGEQSGATLELLTIVGIVFYVILDVIAQLLPPHYSAHSQAESDLAVGPYGLVERTFIGLILLWMLVVALRLRSFLAKA